MSCQGHNGDVCPRCRQRATPFSEVVLGPGFSRGSCWLEVIGDKKQFEGKRVAVGERCSHVSRIFVFGGWDGLEANRMPKRSAGDSVSGKNRLKAAFLHELGLSSEGSVESQVLSGDLVGMAASVMIRRHFSSADVRSVTAYVAEVVEGDSTDLMKRRRVAEALIRFELGELELAGDIEDTGVAFDVSVLILFDLVRRSGFSAERVDELLAMADRDASVMTEFVKARGISVRSFLERHWPGARAGRRRRGDDREWLGMNRCRQLPGG
jgi:hypothetical protein